MAASGIESEFLDQLTKFAQLVHNYQTKMGVLTRKESIVAELTLNYSGRQRQTKLLKIVRKEVSTLEGKVRKLRRRMAKKVEKMKQYDSYYIRSIHDLNVLLKHEVLDTNKELYAASALSTEEKENLIEAAFEKEGIRVTAYKH